MNKHTSFFRSLLLSLLILCAVNSLHAQPPGGDGGGEDPDSAIPIDGGIGILAAAGVAYGITALRKKKTTAE